jgi:hypothetical protein
MTRRSIVVVAATLATAALACADPSTAPQRSQLAPAGASFKGASDLQPCRQGWVSTEGRC